MSGEWMAVVGTAIGATVGGVVTVASLIVKGKQDAEGERRRIESERDLRREDRDWSIRMDSRSSRQERYGTVLEAASGVASQRQRILVIDDLPNADAGRVVNIVIEGFELLEKYDRAISGLEVVAIDREFLLNARALSERSNRFLHAVLEDMPNEELEVMERDLLQLHLALRDGCRRDLGLDIVD
jgi:hypothetical protein